MRSLGIDFGEKRVGIAVCDDRGVLATPLDTIKRVGDRQIEHGQILELLHETGATRIVAGVPYSLDGSLGPAAAAILSEIRGLQKRLRRAGLGVEIMTQDERFTTVSADRALRDGGVRGRQRRQMIDSTAAAVLLQAWLDGQVGG
ncbi:MAG: putative Holliday junction resolvase [Acidimicrobiales bacterium]